MRRIPIEGVIEGQVLAKPLFNDIGGCLMADNIALTHKNIERIKELGFSTIFIQDEYSDEEIKIIKPKLTKDIMSLSAKMLNLSNNNTKNKSEDYLNDLQKLINEIIYEILDIKEVLYSLIDTSRFDNYTYKHSVNVMTLSLIVGKNYGLNIEQLKKLAIASIFHDVGKMFIPRSILNKNGKLTDEEFTLIKKHPKMGFDYLKKMQSLSPVERIVALEHHERFNGEGYPYGKKGKDIHIYSRIVSVCDVFEALISDRPYREGVPINEAREYILGGGGTYFDIEVVKIFAKSINPYPIGTLVRLNDSREGKVEKVNQSFLQRPVIDIYTEDGKRIEPYQIDLVKTNDLVIKDIIYSFAS